MGPQACIVHYRITCKLGEGGHGRGLTPASTPSRAATDVFAIHNRSV
jgi:hypothetical protein